LYIIIAFIAFVAIGRLTTEISVKDRLIVDRATRDCAMRDTYQVLENPIERAITVKTIVEDNHGTTTYTGAYTLFGLRYAEVKTVCDGGAEVRWRRWFNERG